MQVFAPDERVVPVVVSVVLISLPRSVGFGGIVSAAVVAGGVAGLGRLGREHGCALVEMEVDVVLEMDGEGLG